MLIETLVNFLDFDKIDKQLVKKIPYYLLIFILLSLLKPIQFLEQTIQIVLFISLGSFMLFNGIFNHRLNKFFKDYLDYAEFDKFIERLSGIIEGTTTIFSEGYNRRKVAITFGLMVFSGGSLFIFFLSTFALVFQYIEVTLEIQIIMLGILLFFIYSDISKLDFLNQDEKQKQKYSFAVNLMEKFTVTNSMKKIPFGMALQYLVFFSLRLISPIANIKFSAPYSNVLFYYREKDINDMIENYIKAKEGIIFRELEKERCYSLHTIFTNPNPPSLLTLVDRNVKQSFPFLFDPKFYDYCKNDDESKDKKKKKHKSKEPEKPKPDPEIKYTVLRVVSKPKNGDEETVGYIFIRLFHGIFIKRKYEYKPHHGGWRDNEDSHIHKDIQKKFVYCILLMGKRDTMEGIEKLFTTSATKVQAEAFGVEMGNIKNYTQR